MTFERKQTRMPVLAEGTDTADLKEAKIDVSLSESELFEALQDRPVADALVLEQSSGRRHN